MPDHQFTLFFSKDSCALASMAALEETGLDFHSVRVEMSPDGAGDDAFRRLNPRKQVPVLTVGRRVLRENGAIFQFLNKQCPEAHLLPNDFDEQVRAAEWVGYLGGTVHPAFRLLFRPQRWVGQAPEAQLALRTETRNYLQKLLEELDADLSGDWVLQQRSALDFYLFVFAHWTGLINARLPGRLASHHARVLELPAMQRALARQDGAVP
jgi:glutathione S-transferase